MRKEQMIAIILCFFLLVFAAEEPIPQLSTLGQNLSSIICNQNGVLKLSREASIFSNHCPTIIPDSGVTATHRQHWL